MLLAELKRWMRTATWSWEGWSSAWKTEKSLRQWAVVNVLSILLALILDLSAAERALIIALGLVLLATEIMNTAIEAVVDLVSPERHPAAKKAKDCASAAVFLTALAGFVAWLVILLG